MTSHDRLWSISPLLCNDRWEMIMARITLGSVYQELIMLTPSVDNQNSLTILQSDSIFILTLEQCCQTALTTA